MAPKKENSKKVAGNAKKAAAAEAKNEKANAVKAKQEDEEWADGAKSNAKKEQAEAKKREAAAKKAEREAELAAEEAQVKTVKANPKAGAKKEKAPVRSDIDDAFAALDGPSTSAAAALNASGIDNALDALSLTSAQGPAFERHPERRFKAAYAVFEERRMAEAKADGEFAGLRQNQMKERLRKEFERSEENPFNQSGIVGYDADKQTIKDTREKEREAMETRLTGGARK